MSPSLLPIHSCRCDEASTPTIWPFCTNKQNQWPLLSSVIPSSPAESSSIPEMLEFPQSFTSIYYGDRTVIIINSDKSNVCTSWKTEKVWKRNQRWTVCLLFQKRKLWIHPLVLSHKCFAPWGFGLILLFLLNRVPWRSFHITSWHICRFSFFTGSTRCSLVMPIRKLPNVTQLWVTS